MIENILVLVSVKTVFYSTGCSVQLTINTRKSGHRYVIP